MTWWVALSAGVGLLLVLLAIGVPIFISFLLLNVAGVLVFLGPAGFGLFAASIFTTANTNALAVVPLFILMGEILFRSGAMEVLVRFARSADRSAFADGSTCSALTAVRDPLARRRAPPWRSRACSGARSFRSTAHAAATTPHLSAGTILGRRQPRSDHSAQRAGDHHRHAGGGFDGQVAGGRRSFPGLLLTGNVPRSTFGVRVWAEAQPGPGCRGGAGAIPPRRKAARFMARRADGAVRVHLLPGDGAGPAR